MVNQREPRRVEFFMAMKPPETTAQMRKFAVRGGKVRVYVKWLFPVGRGHFDGDWRTTPPDTDNLQKALKDVMTKLRFWGDDAQVASEIAEKFWAARPGIYVVAYEMPVNAKEMTR